MHHESLKMINDKLVYITEEYCKRKNFSIKDCIIEYHEEEDAGVGISVMHTFNTPFGSIDGEFFAYVERPDIEAIIRLSYLDFEDLIVPFI